jgi:endoglucanase
VYRGLNLFGAWQNAWGGTWAFPTTAQLDYYASKRLTTFRVPLLWENLQPQLFGPFDPTYLAAMDTLVARAKARGERISFTFINHGTYPHVGGNPIGSSQVPAAAFYDLWTKMAVHYKDEPTVWAYDLMNEPYLDPGWNVHGQGAINAIRAVDPTKTIIAMPHDEGIRGYQPSYEFTGFNDPSGNLWYEDHIYFDQGSVGAYSGSYDQEGAFPMVGVDRVMPFINWCQAHYARCTVGEFGIPGGMTTGTATTTYGSPSNDPRWNTVLDNFLTVLDQYGISGTYWCAGPYGDVNSVEPNNLGQDRPQMAILERHLGG